MSYTFISTRSKRSWFNPPLPPLPRPPPVDFWRVCLSIQDLSEIQGGYGGNWGLANTIIPSSHSIINSNANASSTNLRDNDHDGGGGVGGGGVGGGGRGPKGSATRAAAGVAANVKNIGGSRISPSKGRSLVSNAA